MQRGAPALTPQLSGRAAGSRVPGATQSPRQTPPAPQASTACGPPAQPHRLRSAGHRTSSVNASPPVPLESVSPGPVTSSAHYRPRPSAHRDPEVKFSDGLASYCAVCQRFLRASLGSSPSLSPHRSILASSLASDEHHLLLLLPGNGHLCSRVKSASHQSQLHHRLPRQDLNEADSEPTNMRGGTALGQMQNRVTEAHTGTPTTPTPSLSPCPEHRLNSAHRKTPVGKPCAPEMSFLGPG